VLVGAVGLALKDHGRGRTLVCAGALRAWSPRPSWANQTLQGPCHALVLQGQASFTIMGRTPRFLCGLTH